jgi:D-glucosaminate PTS system EIIB component
VVAVWCKQYTFTRILIADDRVAADPYLQDVLSLAAPADIDVEVLSVDAAIEDLSSERSDRGTTMVIVRSPEAARRLYEGGVRYDRLNLGGLGARPGRKNIFKNIAASEQEIESLRYLEEQGVRITLHTVPGERSMEFKDLEEKL